MQIMTEKASGRRERARARPYSRAGRGVPDPAGAWFPRLITAPSEAPLVGSWCKPPRTQDLASRRSRAIRRALDSLEGFSGPRHGPCLGATPMRRPGLVAVAVARRRSWPCPRRGRRTRAPGAAHGRRRGGGMGLVRFLDPEGVDRAAGGAVRSHSIAAPKARTSDSHPGSRPADLRASPLTGASGSHRGAVPCVPRRGSAHFNGRVPGARRPGHFTSSPNAEYLAALRALGLRGSTPDQPTSWPRLEREPGFVQDLFALGYYRLTHDLQPCASRARRGLRVGYGRPSATRPHRAQLKAAALPRRTPEFIAELARQARRAWPLNELLSFRIHGVTPAFVQR
jgi:hypothetical protein